MVGRGGRKSQGYNIYIGVVVLWAGEGRTEKEKTRENKCAD